ncbi:MAG: hypothetical protein JSV80_15530, partial [Acidobacteriota bacterium]
AGLTATFWWAGRDQTPAAVEVLVLRVDGRDVSARVIETAGNGTIVVVPAIEQSQREARANDRLDAWATIGGLR